MMERPNWIDYAKVIMIYLVVLGHYTYALGLDFKPSPVWNLMKIITLFHMPFFFIVSGFLFKSISVTETVKKGWIQLLRPYLLMCVISCIIMIIVEIAAHQFSFYKIATLAIGVLTSNDASYSSPNWSSALWFCYSLFLIKLVFSVIQNLGNKVAKMTGGGILLIGAVFILYKGNCFPFRIDSSLVGFLFFSLGYLLKDFFLKLGRLSVMKKLCIILFLVFVLCISAYCNLDFNQSSALSINACTFGAHPLLFLVSGVSGSLIVLILMSFLNVKNNSIRQITLQISNGTIVILGFHWMVYRLLFSSWLSSYNVIWALCVAFVDLIICYFSILLSDKYFPALLGNRKIR